jgi:hypothetical protein
MSPDDFAKLASGVQSIVTILAIVAGGGWAVYTFNRLGTIRKAETDATKALAEVEELRHRIQEYPVLSITLGWQSWKDAQGGRYCLGLTVSFKNDGGRALEFGDVEARLLQRLTAGATAKAPPVRRTRAEVLGEDDRLEVMPFRFLRGGQGRSVGMALPDLAPGDYLLQVDALYFGSAIDGTDAKRSRGATIRASEQAIVTIREEVPAPIAAPRARPARTR